MVKHNDRIIQIAATVNPGGVSIYGLTGKGRVVEVVISPKGARAQEVTQVFHDALIRADEIEADRERERRERGIVGEVTP